MKSLQEYRQIYRTIAQNLGYRGDSVELLVHLLANATYIEEVENISYMEESSLEKSHLVNSKIQHCMDLMYSIYRGSCPRVYIKFRANKIKTLTPYSEIATSSNFSVYFLGYYGPVTEENHEAGNGVDEDGNTENLGFSEGFTFNSDLHLAPDQTYIICGFISKSPINKTVDITYDNPYYIDLDGENLSNDMFVQIAKHSDSGSTSPKIYTVTRDFKDYLLQSDSDNSRYVFDLTTPGYGSRLYFKDSVDVEVSDRIYATYFPYVRVSDFLPNELGKIMISFGELQEFDPGYLTRGDKEIEGKGLIILKESDQENLLEIHYNANKSRYQNSIVRSNEDMGDLLKRYKEYSNIVAEAACVFETDLTTIYYVPQGSARLTTDQINDFIEHRLAYYVTKDINIYPAPSETITLDIHVMLSSVVDNLNNKIKEIVSKYERSFTQADNIMRNAEYEEDNKKTVSLGDGSEDILSQISSAISKITGVEYVKTISFRGFENIKKYNSPFYFKINCIISTSLL